MSIILFRHLMINSLTILLLLIQRQIFIFRFGPMVRTWCMKYEAKHRYFKRLASILGNFTNVAFSLGERHQYQQCYLMNGSGHNYLMKNVDIGKGFLYLFIYNIFSIPFSWKTFGLQAYHNIRKFARKSVLKVC